MLSSHSAIIIATTLFFGTLHAQVSCPNSGGQGVYDGVCMTCPENKWAAGGTTAECVDCPNYRACNRFDGSTTLCTYGIKNCDIKTGNALTCLANFFLVGTGCNACDSGMTSPDGNQQTVCDGECDSPDTSMIGCTPGTDGCNTNTGVSVSCRAGNELIGKGCSPCTANMQQPILASTDRCAPCVTGQDSCQSTGEAITCSVNYYLTANTCTQCPAGQVSGPDNQLGACSAPKICVGKICPASTFVSGVSCNPCGSGTSSEGGINAVCKSCGTGAKSCSISPKGTITIGSCYSTYYLTGGRCKKLYCAANTFAFNSKCNTCSGTTFNPPNNRLPVCQTCRKGEATCTYTAATSCDPTYYLYKGRCYTRNVYDYFYGYQVTDSTTTTLKPLKVIQNLTPAQCLIACEALKTCRSFHASTNALAQPGTCSLYGRVCQMTDITTTSTTTASYIAPRALTLAASKAASIKLIKAKTVKVVTPKAKTVKVVTPVVVLKKVVTPVQHSIHIIMNRRPGQGAVPSIIGIPHLTKTCTTLAGTCFV